MRRTFLFVTVTYFLTTLIAIAASIDIEIASEHPAILGRVTDVTFKLTNNSTQTIAVLEIHPQQPCEDSIHLIRPLYGAIRYDKAKDEYIYDSMPQTQTQISVVEGLMLPGETVSVSRKYRPFAATELFSVNYAIVGVNKIYRREKQQGSGYKFSIRGSDPLQVLLPNLFRMKQDVVSVQAMFPKAQGPQNKYCFCETLKRFVNIPPYTMYKDWDSGKPADFRVGDRQKSIGPERKYASWKFLDEFSVFYGDGMYTHGEFISVEPKQAVAFFDKIQNKYSIRQVQYFFDRYYYDLEPLP
jgi:hypothetical protein